MALAKLPILFTGSGGTPDIQTLELSEESPRILKRFGPSNLIVDQVPDFVNRDHELFRRFVEVYYEWLERYQNAFGVIDAFTELTDIDETLGLFFAEFRAMYLQNFPYQLATDENGHVVSEANFLKNVRNFYGSKGTEKAYRFLFRLLYNVDSEIKYPGEDILKCSHGKWIERQSIKMTSSGGTANYGMEANQVYQIDPVNGNILGSATVTEVIQYQKQYYSVTEVFIKDIFGSFLPSIPIYCNVNGTILEETVYPVISEISILSGGTGYSIHDQVRITTTKNGIGASAAIDVVDEKGKIKSIKLMNSGIDYVGSFSATVISNTGDGKARILPIVGAVTHYPGFYANNNGKLSSSKKLFDGDYYQDFSYALRSEISFIAYKELYKKLVHPAGFKMFGEILIERNVVDSLPFHSEMQRYENPYIGHYTPYRMGTTADLYSIYSSGFNPRGDTFSTFQNYGSSGGKLFVKPIGFTFLAGTTWTTIGASGACGNGISGSVFEFRMLNDGGTYGVLLLKGIDFNTATAGTTGAGFVEGATFRMFTATAGFTATIDRVRFGVGIVPEVGGFTHDTQGKPLGSSSGFEGYIEAKGLSYSYWRIYHHPNIRGIRGLTGVWNGSTGVGASFGAMALNPFFRMPIGYHFHSDPSGTSYVGTTGSNNEYGLIESTTLTSPNF
jgi:hypothetical protein